MVAALNWPAATMIVDYLYSRVTFGDDLSHSSTASPCSGRALSAADPLVVCQPLPPVPPSQKVNARNDDHDALATYRPADRTITDWRGKAAGVRKAILAADREIIEEWKWMGSPVSSRDGMIAVANAHKEQVKLTFAYARAFADPDKLFNAGLEGNMRRAIVFSKATKVNERALKDLVRAAIDYNQSKSKKKAPAGARAKVRKSRKTSN